MGRIRSTARAVCFSLTFLTAIYGGCIVMRALYPVDYLPEVSEAAGRLDLDPALICAVIYAESRFDPSAISPQGAVGLMQIMPATGAWIAEQLPPPLRDSSNLFDPATSILFGSWYLRYLLDRFSHLETALQAYNAGPANAELWRPDPTRVFPETRDYVRRVTNALPMYRLYLRAPWLVRITPSIRL